MCVSVTKVSQGHSNLPWCKLLSIFINICCFGACLGPVWAFQCAVQRCDYETSRKSHNSVKVMTSHRFSSQFHFWFRFWWLQVEVYCIPHFSDISVSMAEICQIPVSVNKRPPCCSSTSGFDFHICIIMGVSLCICLPNFVQIGPSATELWRHIHF